MLDSAEIAKEPLTPTSFMSGAPWEISLEPNINVSTSDRNFQMLLRKIEAHHETVVKGLEKKLDDLRQTSESTADADIGGRILPAVPEETSFMARFQAHTAMDQSLERIIGQQRDSTITAKRSISSTVVAHERTIATQHQMHDSPRLIGKGLTKTLELSGYLEAPSSHRLTTLVTSKMFNDLCVVAICMNAIFLGVQTDIAARRSNPQDLPSSFEAFDLTFCLWFTFEVFLRMSGVGVKKFFYGLDSRWNIFDIVIVTGDGIDTIIRLSSDGKFLLQNITAMRVLRLMRIVHTVRVIRLVRFFRELRLMVSSVLRSGLPFLWSVLFLFIIIFIFGVYLTQCATSYVYEHKLEGGKTVVALQSMFKSLVYAEYMLFMCISGGVSWIEVSTPLLEAHWSNAVVFCFFIFFTVFAVLNIITGIFVDTATNSAQSDREEMVLHQMYAEQDIMEEIKKCFAKADSDRSGQITLEELRLQLLDPKVRAYFAVVGIEVNDAASIFRLFDLDKSGEINIKEFIWGCLKMKGQAKSIDLITLIHENRRAKTKMVAALDSVEHRLGKIEGTMDCTMDFIACTLKDQNNLLKTASMDVDATPTVKQPGTPVAASRGLPGLDRARSRPEYMPPIPVEFGHPRTPRSPRQLTAPWHQHELTQPCQSLYQNLCVTPRTS